MKFPILVYKSPGTHQCPRGTFDYLQVCDMDELKNASDDYYPTIDLALEKPADFDWDKHAEANGWLDSDEDDSDEDDSDEVDSDEDKDPPTREELEIKATELGIKFQSSIKDETLLKKIEAKLAESEG
jgi:hypothetical protein